MRYFTRGWANGELTEEEGAAVNAAYRARIAEIAPRLPPAMIRLRQGVSLHDAVIESVRWDPSRKRLRLALVAEALEVGYQLLELTYHGAMLGKARIDSLRNVVSNKGACVLYQELDISEDGDLVHRLLFYPNEEVTIDFRSLDYTSTPRADARMTFGGVFAIESHGEPLVPSRSVDSSELKPAPAAFSLSDGEVRAWVDGGIHLKAVTAYGDPVELSKTEAREVIVGLERLIEESR